MRYREDGPLDTSSVQDRRGGGRAVAIGGGGLGVVGIIVVVLIQLLGGSGSTTDAVSGVLGDLSQGQTASSGQLSGECRTTGDANSNTDCAIVADIDSIQDYWSGVMGSRYVKADTVFFSGSAQTGCGAASSGTGPFYCPADKLVYIDLTFFDDLKSQFGAEGGAFVDAYVLAHEYGHHVQDLLGTESQVQAGVTGPKSGSVRLELQADCFAGVWANHASTVPDASGAPLISEITSDDISRALDTAGRIGDDYIQTHLGSGSVDQGSFTHGSSAQRQHWFTVGYQGGEPASCDTFAANALG